MCYPVLDDSSAGNKLSVVVRFAEIIMTVLTKVTSTVPVSKKAFPLTYAVLPNHLICVWEGCITLRNIFIHESLMTDLSVRGET